MKRMATRNIEALSDSYRFVFGMSMTMGVVYLLGIACEICHLIYGGW